MKTQQAANRLVFTALAGGMLLNGQQRLPGYLGYEPAPTDAVHVQGQSEASLIPPLPRLPFAQAEWVKKFGIEGIQTRIDAIFAEVEGMIPDDKVLQHAMTAVAGTPQYSELRRQLVDRHDLERSLIDESKALLELQKRLRAQPECHALFLSTIDKKGADLTVRETDSIAACRRLGVYK